MSNTPKRGDRLRRCSFAVLGSAFLILPMAGLHACEAAALTPAAAVAAVEAAGKTIEGLRAPLSLLRVDRYRDGGTISFVLRDGAGTELQACVDGRDVSTTRGCFYVNASHPTQQGALLLPTGGKAAGALLEALEKLDLRDTEEGKFVSWAIASLKERRKLAAESAAKGPLTGEQAIQIALSAGELLVRKTEKVETFDHGDVVDVVFYDDPGTALPGTVKGVGTSVSVIKETRQPGTVKRYEPGK